MADKKPQVSPAARRLGEIGIALGIVGILIVMVIPLPTVLLDILLSLSITISLIILLVSFYMTQPLQFSVFPALLLVVTLFRLSLNVASTRLILLYGNTGTDAAGKVIQSFGQFVVGGNYVVGAVVFTILVIINFVVITKGSVRTSEVAARFTLDAIPGKQMSIDADLNAGLITEQEARGRRRKLEQEADFYGSMDGAVRFVRGDAIAGIIITITNILGGLIIGLALMGMSFQEALTNYTLLTVGDGLVVQLPALLVSTATGIVVTRAAGELSLGEEISVQMLVYPKAFAISSGVLVFLALIPGLPHMAFLTLAGFAGAIAYFSHESQQREIREEKERKEKEARAPVPERVEALLPLDVMELEIGYQLIPLVDAEQDGELLERIKSIRRQFALEMGFIVPPIHIRDNLQLKSNEYVILLKGVQVAKGELWLNHYLAIDPGTGVMPIPGHKTKEPTFGLPALWVTEENKERAKNAGYTVVDVPTVVTTHLKEVIKTHAHELLGRQETDKIIQTFKEQNPKVVEELIPNILTLGQVQKVLQNLLREQISIRDLLTILETLADVGALTKDTDVLTEQVRQALARPISRQFTTEEGSIPVLTLDRGIEDRITQSIKQTDRGAYLALEPSFAQQLLDRVKKEIEKFTQMNYQPILLSSPVIRGHLQKLTERFIPNLVVLSHNEISPDSKIQAIGVVRMG